MQKPASRRNWKIGVKTTTQELQNRAVICRIRPGKSRRRRNRINTKIETDAGAVTEWDIVHAIYNDAKDDSRSLCIYSMWKLKIQSTIKHDIPTNLTRSTKQIRRNGTGNYAKVHAEAYAKEKVWNAKIRRTILLLMHMHQNRGMLCRITFSVEWRTWHHASASKLTPTKIRRRYEDEGNVPMHLPTYQFKETYPTPTAWAPT